MPTTSRSAAVVVPRSCTGKLDGSTVLWSGSGPSVGRTVVVLPNWASHLYLDWSTPNRSRFLHLLSSFVRVVRFDLPGAGLSPRHRRLSMEQYLAYVDAVVEATGDASATLLADGVCGPAALTYAATRPGRVDGLVLLGTAARFCGPTGSGLLNPDLPEILVRLLCSDWQIGTRTLTSLMLPNADPELCAWFTEYQQTVTTAEAAAPAVEVLLGADATPYLSDVRCPALVVHHRDAAFPPIGAGRGLAEELHDATLDVRPGAADDPALQDTEAVVARIREFLVPAQHQLTSRELAVVAQLARGLSNRGIARELGIAESTVARHVANLFGKLGVNNRVSAVTGAERLGALPRSSTHPSSLSLGGARPQPQAVA